MDDLNQRQAIVLNGVVREYINTAEPVGSVALREAIRVSASPATLRAILRELEEAGYLEQPHTSAGRVPTDLGYRYFVNHVNRVALTAVRRRQLRRQLHQMVAEYGQVSRPTTMLLSRLAGTIVVSSVAQRHSTDEAGFSEIFKDGETVELEALQELSNLLNKMEQHALELQRMVEDRSQVFIGGEIPFFPARYTSLVVRTIQTSKKQSMVVSIMGPKRMHYARNMALLDAIADILESK